MDAIREKLVAMENPAPIAIAVTVAIAIITTRLLSGSRGQNAKDGFLSPSLPPYWAPFLGHIPQMVIGGAGFMPRLLKSHPEGIFSLQLLGSIHSYVTRPAFATVVMNKPESVASEKWLHKRLMLTNFGFAKSDTQLLDEIFPPLHDLYQLLLSGPSLADLTDSTISTLKARIADFVTFNSQPADQMEWEQLAGADVVDDGKGGKVVEVDLMSLTKNFVAHVATPSFFGTDFVANFPDYFQHLWAFDEQFFLLMAGLPSWFPYPPLQRVHRARRKLLSYMEEFHDAMDKHVNGQDPGPRWQDLDNVGYLIRKRMDVYHEHKVQTRVRAAVEMSLTWATNANSNPLIFWSIFELCRDRVLLAQVREEIAPYVEVVEPQNEFGLAVWMAPEFKKLDMDGLLTKCPLLKAVYAETLRVYTNGYTLKYMQQDVTLGKPGDPAGSYMLKEGTYAHVAAEMHQRDPVYYPDPEEWQAARHVKEVVDEKGNKTLTADLGTMRPYGTFSYYFHPQPRCLETEC